MLFSRYVELELDDTVLWLLLSLEIEELVEAELVLNSRKELSLVWKVTELVLFCSSLELDETELVECSRNVLDESVVELVYHSRNVLDD